MQPTKAQRMSRLSGLKKVILSNDLQRQPTMSDGKIKPFTPELLQSPAKASPYKIKPNSRGSPLVLSTNQSIHIEKVSNSPVRPSTNAERNQRILSNSGIQMSDVNNTFFPRSLAVSGIYSSEVSPKFSAHARLSVQYDNNRHRSSFMNFDESNDNSPLYKHRTPDRARGGTFSRTIYPIKTQVSYDTNESLVGLNQSPGPQILAKRPSRFSSSAQNKSPGSAMMNPLFVKIDKILQEVERSVSPVQNIEDTIAIVRSKTRLSSKYYLADSRKRGQKVDRKKSDNTLTQIMTDISMVDISKKLEDFRYEASSDLVKLQKMRPPTALKLNSKSQVASNSKMSPLKVWKTDYTPANVENNDKHELRKNFIKSINFIIRKLIITNINVHDLMRDQPFPTKAYERENSKLFFERVRIGDVKAVERFLFECPYHVYDFDSLRQTALHWAAKRGFSLIIKMLIDNKADPDARDLSGRTPLFLAARSGSVDCVKLLINAGANPMLKSGGNKIALDSASNLFVRNVLKKAYKLHVVMGMFSYLKTRQIWDASDRRDFVVQNKDLTAK